jgi:hypothetical protein
MPAEHIAYTYRGEATGEKAFDNANRVEKTIEKEIAKSVERGCKIINMGGRRGIRTPAVSKKDSQACVRHH